MTNFSFLALTVCDLCYYEDLEEKADGLTDLINYKAFCRTAPATLGQKEFSVIFYCYYSTTTKIKFRKEAT